MTEVVRVSGLIPARTKNPIREYTWFVVDNDTGEKISLDGLNSNVYTSSVVDIDSIQTLTNKNLDALYLDGVHVTSSVADLNAVEDIHTSIDMEELTFADGSTSAIQTQLDSLKSSLYKRMYVSKILFNSNDATVYAGVDSGEYIITARDIKVSLGLDDNVGTENAIVLSSAITPYLFSMSSSSAKNEWRAVSLNEDTGTYYDLNYEVKEDGVGELFHIRFYGSKLKQSNILFICTLIFNIKDIGI